MFITFFLFFLFFLYSIKFDNVREEVGFSRVEKKFLLLKDKV